MPKVKAFTVKVGDNLLFLNGGRHTVRGNVIVEEIKDEGNIVYFKFNYGELRINKKKLVEKIII